MTMVCLSSLTEQKKSMTFLTEEEALKPAFMTAPVGRSVHRMGCVFHPPLHPTLTNILPESIFLPADL